jgi:hypothetical protein
VWVCDGVVGGTVGVWVCDGVVGGTVGVWVCDGGAVGVWMCDGVTACAGVVVTFTVVVLLELHPVMARAATAAVAIPQIIFLFSISPPSCCATMAWNALLHPGRADVGIGHSRLDTERA